jgi:hypothetical protein
MGFQLVIYRHWSWENNAAGDAAPQPAGAAPADDLLKGDLAPAGAVQGGS